MFPQQHEHEEERTLPNAHATLQDHTGVNPHTLTRVYGFDTPRHPFAPVPCPHERGISVATQEVACALQKAWGTQRPRSYKGWWQGFTGDYEKLALRELKEEALCEGVPHKVWDRLNLAKWRNALTGR